MPDIEIDQFPEALTLLDDFKLHVKNGAGVDEYIDATVIGDYIAAKIAQYTAVTPASDDSVLLQDVSNSSAVRSALVSDLANLFSTVSGVSAVTDGGIVVTDNSGDQELEIDFANVPTENTVDTINDLVLFQDATDGSIKKTAVTNAGLTGAVETGSLLTGELQLGATIIKLFSFNSVSDDNEVISFPSSFPTACRFVHVTGNRYPATAFNWNQNEFTINRADDASGTNVFYAMAFGD